MAFDFAVIGLGAAGSAALAALARSGARAIGIDRFAPPHDQGSSHGETRLLRVAYAEGAQYVPMARRAIELWRDLEARTGAELFRQTGVVYAGPCTSPFLSASLASAETYDVHIDELTGAARAATSLHIPDDWLCCAENEGGYLLAEKAIAALLSAAAKSGAEVMRHQPCRAIETDESGVRVVTETEEIQAGKCVVAAGGWARELLPALAPYLHIERKTLHWFADPHAHYTQDAFRPFLIDDEDGRQFYGFPDCGSGVKVAEHTAPGAFYARADDIARAITPADTETIGVFAARHLTALGERLHSVTCLYPMSQDGHFILDAYPGSERIVVAAGLSGHGFKFAPAIGEAMANLATDTEQKIDVAPFSLGRFNA